MFPLILPLFISTTVPFFLCLSSSLHPHPNPSLYITIYTTHMHSAAFLLQQQPYPSLLHSYIVYFMCDARTDAPSLSRLQKAARTRLGLDSTKQEGGLRLPLVSIEEPKRGHTVYILRSHHRIESA